MKPRRVRSLIAEQGGIVAVWAALGISVIIGFCAFAVDLGNWYWTGDRMQKAADAGALGGVPFMPAEFDTAKAVAIDLVGKNGFVDGANASVSVTQGTSPTQIRVTVTHTVRNAFTVVFGLDKTVITRSALADYEGPVPMGSPENFLGNEPVGSDPNDPFDDPWGASQPPPQMWINLAGPGNNKVNGDRYATKYCSSGNAGCSGTTNVEYDGNNHFFSVRVAAVDATKHLYIQAFDPAYVLVGDRCTRDTLAGASTVGGFPDASTRYAMGPGAFCTGDEAVNGPPSPSPVGFPTTYIVRAPDSSPWNLTDNPIINTGSCRPTTYPAYTGGTGFIANRLRTDAAFAAVFRRWVTVCSIPPGQVVAGDYILQIRSNAMPAPNQHLEDPNALGEAHNRLSLRAAFAHGGGGAPDGGRVRMFATGRLPIYANADGSDTRFHLARVLPSTNERTLKVSLFDTGDAADVGTITILRPDGTPYSQCKWTRSDGAPLNSSGCSLYDVHAANGYNGRAVDVDVTIPADYTCSIPDPRDCWTKIKFNYLPGIAVSDTTTWSARLAGNTVRLVE